MPEAENKKPDQKTEAKRPPDNFVAKLVSDPANPPNLIRMTGYRGASSQEGSIRLYANPDLSVYWDIPEADILHEQPVPHDTDPLGAVTLWVKRDSKMTSNLTQQQASGGGQQPMNTFTPGAAAAPQQPQLGVPITITFTHQSILCHSPYYYCPPSPPPLLCVSPIPHCPPHSPLAICNVSPLPICVQPVSPTCPPTQPTTIPTTIPTQPTTIQTGPQLAGMQAAPQGAGQQAFTIGGGTFGPIPPSIFQQCPSQFVICPTPSVLLQCTIHHSIFCNSPTPICVLPVSPTCTPGTFPTLPTIPTTGDPGTGFAGGGGGAVAGGFQAAAPQALSPQFGPAGIAQASPVAICYRLSPVIFQCFHSYYYPQCPHPSPTPICVFQVPQTPNLSPVTPGPLSPVAGGFGGQVAQGAAQQALTPWTLPTYPTWPTFPTHGPTYGPTWPPTHITITHTPPVTWQ